MSYELLRSGTENELHLAAQLSDNGGLLGFISVRSEIVDPYALVPETRLIVEEHGPSGPIVSSNALENSLGTAAEKRYARFDATGALCYGAPEESNDARQIDPAGDLFANPWNLATLADVVELARYERYQQAVQTLARIESSFDGDAQAHHGSAEECLLLLEEAQNYAMAGNWALVDELLSYVEDDLPTIHDERVTELFAVASAAYQGPGSRRDSGQ